MSESVSQTVDRQKLNHDLQEVITDAEALLSATAGDLGEKAREARAKLSQRIAAAKEKIAAGAKQADQVIRTHPYESIGVAFGVGLLIGFLATRK